jgi:hypothetical protein
MSFAALTEDEFETYRALTCFATSGTKRIRWEMIGSLEEVTTFYNRRLLVIEGTLAQITEEGRRELRRLAAMMEQENQDAAMTEDQTASGAMANGQP